MLMGTFCRFSDLLLRRDHDLLESGGLASASDAACTTGDAGQNRRNGRGKRRVAH